MISSYSSYKKADALSAEIEEGNREYKFKLTDLTDEQLQHRITQLHWRLNEGNDEAIYQIGVEDDGYPLGLPPADLEASLANLQIMADAVGCSLTVRQIFTGELGLTAEVLLRRLERQILSPDQVHVAMVGDVDVGKSTLIGVLSTGKLDNGRGLARMQVFTHNHEVCSGRTSSVSEHNLYFSVAGKVLNVEPEARGNRLRSRSELELADVTARIVSFIDLAGHSKYLKTTLSGLVSRAPDHCMVCISAKKGVQRMTSEHLGAASALNLPLVIAITKVDESSPSGVAALVAALTRALSNKRRRVVLIETEEQLAEMLLHKAHALVDPTPAPAPTAMKLPPDAQLDESMDGPTRGVLTKEGGDINHDRGVLDSNHEAQGPREHNSIEARRDQSSLTPAAVNSPTPSLTTAPLSVDVGVGGCGGRVKAEPVVVPLFLLSSVTGQGLDLLRFFFFHLPPSGAWDKQRDESAMLRFIGSFDVSKATTDPVTAGPGTSPEGAIGPRGSGSGPGSTGIAPNRARLLKSASTPNMIDRSLASGFSDMSPPTSPPQVDGGVGAVGSISSAGETAGGIVLGDVIYLALVERGNVECGEALLLGPTRFGTFEAVRVRSLRVNNVPVRSAVAGQCVTLSLVTSPELVPPQGTKETESPDETAAPAQGPLIVPTSKASIATATPTDGHDVTPTKAKVPISRSMSSLTSDTLSTSKAPGHVSGSPDMAASRRRPTAGLVLLGCPSDAEARPPPRAHWEFDAEVLVLNHPSKIRPNYEPVCHIGSIKQSARLLSFTKLPASPRTPRSPSSMVAQRAAPAPPTPEVLGADGGDAVDTEELGNGDKALCRFRFLYHPEYLVEGSAILIREGQTRGVGKIISGVVSSN